MYMKFRGVKSFFFSSAQPSPYKDKVTEKIKKYLKNAHTYRNLAECT